MAKTWAGLAEALKLEVPKLPHLRVLGFDFDMGFRGDAPIDVDTDAGDVQKLQLFVDDIPDNPSSREFMKPAMNSLRRRLPMASC